jgi:uncharacterized protein (DUF924 family)
VTEKSNSRTPDRVLDFWFADALAGASALALRSDFWFGEGADRAQVDREIEGEFRDEIELAAGGGLGEWAATPRGRLALILLCDQFPRNVFRGTPRAFASDARALELTLDGMRLRADAELHPVERVFFYMPLEHAERPDTQERAVQLLTTLAREAPAQTRFFFDDSAAAAGRHREIIRRFGRFPHRNAILGRASTEPEREYLAGDVEDFGQKA